jgi:molybdopterin converting factor small subunit
MHVHVHLFGSFSRYSPTGSDKFQIEIETPDSVGRLLERIGFPLDMERMVIVNGSQSGPSTPLMDGDDIFIYYPAAGG